MPTMAGGFLFRGTLIVAGDSIVFLRAENGDLCVGIRPRRGLVGDSRAPLAGTLLEEAVPYGLGCIQNRGQKGIKKAHMASGVPKTEAKGDSVASVLNRGKKL